MNCFGIISPEVHLMKKITWNSPVILWFALISLGALILNGITGGRSNYMFFSVWRGSLKDPLFYLRLFTHVLGHADLSHYANNMLIFLLVGPLLEEKYGSRKLLEIMAVTALITGIVHVLVDPNSALIGASGIDFAFILMASVTGSRRDGEIPLTLLIAAAIYLSQQIIAGVSADNISQLTHVIGGAIGAVYGMAFRPSYRKY